MRDMTNQVFFCDTYALIEIINGNTSYAKYVDFILLTSDYNLMELHYAFLRDYNKKTADHFFDQWSTFLVRISHEVIKQAMEFKLAYKQENLSYVDCIGYSFSQQHGIKFLTGDIKFKDKPGVEFVK